MLFCTESLTYVLEISTSKSCFYNIFLTKIIIIIKIAFQTFQIGTCIRHVGIAFFIVKTSEWVYFFWVINSVLCEMFLVIEMFSELKNISSQKVLAQ